MFTQYLYTDAHRSFAHNSQNLETAQMDFNQWMVKQTVVQPHRGKLLSNKEEQIIGIHNNLEEAPENYAKWEKQIPKVTY